MDSNVSLMTCYQIILLWVFSNWMDIFAVKQLRNSSWKWILARSFYGYSLIVCAYPCTLGATLCYLLLTTHCSSVSARLLQTPHDWAQVFIMNLKELEHWILISHLWRELIITPNFIFSKRFGFFFFLFV